VETPAVIIRIGAPSDLLWIVIADPLCQSTPDRAKRVEGALLRGECLVAVDRETVVGYAILDASFFGQAFVPLLVVKVAHRRRGVGTSLLADAEARCIRDRLFTSTNEFNVAAQCLFEKRNFLPSGRIENLDDVDDELIFCKWLRRAA
jgi:ribosomal protein S18 acetylase RimI-like enzyme